MYCPGTGSAAGTTAAVGGEVAACARVGTTRPTTIVESAARGRRNLRARAHPTPRVVIKAHRHAPQQERPPYPPGGAGCPAHARVRQAPPGSGRPSSVGWPSASRPIARPRRACRPASRSTRGTDDRRGCARARRSARPPCRDLAVGGDRRVRPDVAVAMWRALADDGRPTDARAVTSSAPRSMTTRPSTRDASSTAPSIHGSSVSRMRRLLSSSGSFLPVSIHQPSSTSWRTRWPWSISHWMASVISSSPRADGLDRAHRLVDRGVEQVDADEREVGRRVGRLLDQLRRPRRRRPISATPNWRGSSTCASRICAAAAPHAVERCGRARAAASNASTNSVEALLRACCRRGTSRSRRRRGSRGR